jgi:hypothetical protein
MMHNHKVVISLTDEHNKPYREHNFKKLHDKCKTCEVILPFNSNYKILVKNDFSSRLKLDIDIDGTFLTGAGGLIISANSQDYIERFIETAKKLYFVKKDNEKVSDPTNKENGFLTVKIEREKAADLSDFTKIWLETLRNRHEDLSPRRLYDPWNYGEYVPVTHPYPRPEVTWRYTQGPTCGGGNNISAASAGVGSKGVNGSFGSSNTLYCSSVQSSFNASMSSNENATLDVGATVEGEVSSQVFTTTTWNGAEPDSDIIFQIKMLGQEVKLSAQEEKDLMDYKRLKEKFEGKK